MRGPSRPWAGVIYNHLVAIREALENDRPDRAMSRLTYLINRFYTHATGDSAYPDTRRTRP